MSIALYMDVHVPRQITRGLRRRGVDVLTAQEDGTVLWSDPALLDRATELNRVLFSQDQDLLREANGRQRDGVAFCGVCFAAQIGVSIGQLIEDLELLAKAGEERDLESRVQFLPLH